MLRIIWATIVWIAVIGTLAIWSKSAFPQGTKACTVEDWNKGASQCELSYLRVQNKQLAAQSAFNVYQSAVAALSAAADEAKKENHWGEDVQYNMQAGAFVTVSKAPAPAKPEEPKK